MYSLNSALHITKGRIRRMKHGTVKITQESLQIQQISCK